MAEERAQRHLAAILAADVVGYSRLMGQDEAGTFERLRAQRQELFEPEIAKHQGRIFKLMGDGLLAEFASVVDAVECAVTLQRGMAVRNAAVANNRRIDVRMGINLGDVIIDGEDRHGDGVNIAARLQGLAERGGILISGTVYDQVKTKVAVAYAYLGERTVKNIADPVRVYRVLFDPALAGLPSERASSSENQLPSSKPSIAVLPFTNLSADPEQEFFADGLTEDIITALSHVSALWVIARTSTFTYKGKPMDVKRIAQELGVRYVMEGSVRRAGDRLRVTAQLIDAVTGHQVWAERYDRTLADLFDIQDEITRSVAASTETQVAFAERQAAESRPSIDFRARDLVARAWARIYDQTPEAIEEASDLVEEAIRVDPSNPTAHRVRAAVFLNRFWIGEPLHDEASRARAFELATTALRLARHDEYAHMVMAYTWAYAAPGRLEEAIAECERGLEINPNCSLILGHLGYYLAALGRSQRAIEVCRLCLQLNPRDPCNFWRHQAIAAAHLVAADYVASLQESKRIARSRPHLPSALIWAASAAALDNADEARIAVEDCLAQRHDLRVSGIVPNFMLRFARDEDHERLLALLRKAGLPE